MDILDLLAEDRELIAYRKSLNNITGGVMPTLLLQQILFYAKNKGWQPFYKFRKPCGHDLYQPGDSWKEELGFIEYEFDSALEKIGTKIVGGVKKADVLKTISPKSIILYWTDANRITWYMVNRQLLGNLIKCNYLENGVCPITWESDEMQLHEESETPTQITSRENPPLISNYDEPKPGPFTQALIDLCQINYTTATNKLKRSISATVKGLAAAGVTKEQLELFALFWQSNWRGKDGSPPTLNLVRECWGEFGVWDTQGRPRSNGKKQTGYLVKADDEYGGYYA